MTRSLFLILLFLIFSTIHLYSATLGDVNNDDSIDIVDALLIAKTYVGLPPEGFDTSRADTNCDGKIDIVDALLVAQYYVRLILSFPCEKPSSPRTIISFDKDWLFNKGNASGAQQAEYNDFAWQTVNVPHDWSIEGPFSASNPSGAPGGYLPMGVSWYRKHFTLEENHSSSLVFIEFDGVMAHSDVYINGHHLGNRPFGYVSFRYELTDHLYFGSKENIIAVKSDTSAQPASRWYSGSGIYRHVRIIITNPLHIDKWASYVTTPIVSDSQATVHLQTKLVNQGPSTQNVSIQAVIIDPSGNKLEPVSSNSLNISTGGSADFNLDIQVPNPRLWSVESPQMYQLVTKVQSGGKTLDNENTPFGIRTIRFDADRGFYLNGINMKFKGVCLHHDMSGLGAAVPLRAWERRFEQLKELGVNAIRTSHNPVAPEVLDLCDTMGFLVMNEFFDVWRSHKEPADYASDFNTWGTIDLKDTLMRDRNHPSIVMYSIGNEIRDSLSTRLPIARDLVSICHDIDPTRPVTQGLFRPKNNGDYPGAMLDVLDVFGVNYRTTELLEAQLLSPHHPGVLTEVAPTQSNWNFVISNPQVEGMFVWTGVDYLGESSGWPNVGSGFGLLDRVGTPRDIGYTFQQLWSTNPVKRPRTAYNATKINLSADQNIFTTDGNDLVYIKASIYDSNNGLITNASNSVTFNISGPGKIIAVDSGINTGESFRGNSRKAFGGICFAIIQATAPGQIRISASSSGLTGSSITVEAIDGSFIP